MTMMRDRAISCPALVPVLVLFLLVSSGSHANAQSQSKRRSSQFDLARHAAVLANVKPVDAVLVRDKQELEDHNAKGPTGPPIDLEAQTALGGLDDFPGVNGLQSLVNLSLKVYPDANPESNIYYYYAAGYFLSWDPDNRYYLSLDFKYEQESGQNVLIDARLSPGNRNRDREFLREILRDYLKKHGSPQERQRADSAQLYELPARYEVAFDLSQLGATNVSISGIDEVTRQIALTLTTDVPTRELLIKKLGDGLGVAGRVRILPEPVSADTPALSPFEVSARLMLTDASYADTRWQRASGAEYSEFRNQHDFPVRMRYLCYLYRESSGLKLRGYNLGDRVLAPGGLARIPNARVTNQIDHDGKVVRAWYEYALVNDPDTRKDVIARLTGGVANLPVKRVAVEIVKPDELFEQYHIHKVVVLARSRFFDPDGGELIEHSYELTREDSRGQLDAIYAEPGESETLYEYRIGVITQAGEQFLDGEWRSPSLLGDITIGANQIGEVIAQ